MHYYKKNIGDYLKKAGRLSMIQHGAYTVLIDCCFDREQFPTLDEAIDWTWASSKEEVEAVEFVLKKFFVFENDRYVEKWVEEELAKYHANSKVNKRIAQAREAAKKTTSGNNENQETSTERAEKTTNRERSVKNAQPNQKPRTINQEPRTNKTTKDLSKSDAFDREGAFDEFWKAYPRSEGKKLAKDKFNKVCKDPVTFAEVMLGLREQVPKIRDVKFFPHATTWLNGERWHDEVSETGVRSVIDKFVNMESRHG